MSALRPLRECPDGLAATYRMLDEHGPFSVAVDEPEPGRLVLHVESPRLMSRFWVGSGEVAPVERRTS